MTSTDQLALSRVPGRTIAVLVATEVFALGSLMMPIVVELALKVDGFDLNISPEAAFSLVASRGAVVAMAADPLFGHASDRSRD